MSCWAAESARREQGLRHRWGLILADSDER